MKASRSTPVAAILTGKGRGAISAIRLWGAGCRPVIDLLFRPHVGIPISESPVGRLRVGTFGKGQGDEVVALKVSDDPPVFEIQGHGGEAALQRTLEGLRAESVKVVDAETWLGDQGGGGIESQALFDLQFAPTLPVAERLIDQADGALSDALRRIESLCVGNEAEAIDAVETLIERGVFGCRMLSGWTVAMAGRPNVGKSSLFNALLGFGRAIVDPSAGTTRDRIRARTALGGWPIELFDLAGIRRSDDLIEREGIRRAEDSASTADLVLLVVDRSAGLEEGDLRLIGRWPHALRVANKSDLAAAWDARAGGFLPVSARTGEGLADLIDTITSRIVPHAIPVGSAVPFRESQVARLHQLKSLLLSRGSLPQNLPAWVVA